MWNEASEQGFIKPQQLSPCTSLDDIDDVADMLDQIQNHNNLTTNFVSIADKLVRFIGCDFTQ